MTRIALCFPGQGSQTPGMAAGLDATELGARLLRAAADQGVDLGAALSGEEELLRPTDVAQPALIFTEVVLAAALPRDLEVVAVAGHSVGELAACAAAGVMAPEVTLRLAVERGRRMAAMQEGTMAAVLGLEAETLTGLCAEVGGGVVVANLNAPGQVVVSGPAAAVAELLRRARAAGARRVVPLRVSGAFHSPLMAEAAAGFARVLDSVPMSAAAVPIVANVDAEAVSDPAGIRDRLRRQMVSPVRWTESVDRMVRLGAEALVEVGPGGVLSGLAHRIAPGTPALSVSSRGAAAALRDRLAAATGNAP